MATRIKVEVKGLVLDPATNVPMVVLRAEDVEGGFVLPIWVGVFEANAIALQLEGIETPRPMTHDLLRDAILKLGAQVSSVDITDVRDTTFFAAISLLTTAGETVTLDARPSDAIALALHAGAPLYVTPGVIEKAQAYDPSESDPDKLRAWFEGLGADPLEM